MGISLVEKTINIKIVFFVKIGTVRWKRFLIIRRKEMNFILWNYFYPFKFTVFGEFDCVTVFYANFQSFNYGRSQIHV